MANKIVAYIRESREELRRVIWPSRRQTIQNGLLVIGISLVVALFLGVVDFALNLALEQVIR